MITRLLSTALLVCALGACFSDPAAPNPDEIRVYRENGNWYARKGDVVCVAIVIGDDSRLLWVLRVTPGTPAAACPFSPPPYAPYIPLVRALPARAPQTDYTHFDYALDAHAALSSRNGGPAFEVDPNARFPPAQLLTQETHAFEHVTESFEFAAVRFVHGGTMHQLATESPNKSTRGMHG